MYCFSGDKLQYLRGNVFRLHCNLAFRRVFSFLFGYRIRIDHILSSLYPVLLIRKVIKSFSFKFGYRIRIDHILSSLYPVLLIRKVIKSFSFRFGYRIRIDHILSSLYPFLLIRKVIKSSRWALSTYDDVAS